VDNLCQFRADKQNGGPILDKTLDQSEYFGLCTYVDAARRFIKNEESAACTKPFANYNLLLIASAENTSALSRVTRRDPQGIDE
jgi:hypothetical protein